MKHIHMVGIGGIGMSALARYFVREGIKVTGYDKTETALCCALISEGIEVYYEPNPNRMSAKLDLVIYSPAVPKDMPELVKASELGIRTQKRSEILGEISKKFRSIAVAGTHGKTTTTAILAHILNEANYSFMAFVGGIMTNYNTNFIAKLEGDSKESWVLMEADEFDRSFHQLFPDITVVTSMDADHLDVYGSAEEMISAFHKFAGHTKEGGIVLHHESFKLNGLNRKCLSYGSANGSTFNYGSVEVKNNKLFADFKLDQTEKRKFEFGLPGNHNMENALAAASVALHLGIPVETIQSAIRSFKGVKRRFEYIQDIKSPVFIDDYAHHPMEINKLIESVRLLYPGKRITGVFQPHLFSRTRDFALEFANELSKLDEVVLLPIYPAREQPIEGISSKMIYDLINLDHSFKHLLEKQELIPFIDTLQTDLLLTIGAGDIDKEVQKIKNHFLQSAHVE